MDLLTFTLDTHRYALPRACVHEVVRAVAVAPLPSGPEVVKGMINLRGRIVPVFDVRRRFGAPAAALLPEHHFVVAQAGPRVVALWVDRAADIVSVPDDHLEPAAVAPGARYLAGVARLPDGLLVIHDVERFLSLDEAGQLDAALRGPEPAGTTSKATRG